MEMKSCITLCRMLLLCLGAAAAAAALHAQQIPLEVFASGEGISDAAISPDGRYIAEIVRLRDGPQVVVVRDLKNPTQKPNAVLSEVNKNIGIRWCSFATPSRLLCSYRGNIDEAGVLISFTRLVAVDADGKNQLILLRNGAGGQFQDQVVDWTPGKPDTVLIQAEEDLTDEMTKSMISTGADVYGQTTSGAYPALFELNVVTGKTKLVLHARAPILDYLSDFHGHARIASGYESGRTTEQFFVREATERTWTHLLKFEAFQVGDRLVPVAIDAENPNFAYAIGNSGDHDALWSIDLTDQQSPKIIYGNDAVDVDGPVQLKSGEMLGVSYETDRPHMNYTNSPLAGVLRKLDAALSETSNKIIDCTSDRSLCIVRSRSDVEPGLWYLLDTSAFRLIPLGRSNPGLNSQLLAHLSPIHFAARDGTIIPGYLMIPPGTKAEHLPLIVMPHGGPIARDRWEYFFLQQFLVNRGYAVLQMNFRGSGGFGQAWYSAAHQDWGGLTYSDIADGARWAVSSGIADPQRMAIVGWSFGGYAALLGAVRDSALFRCAVSIAGISDLTLMLSDSSNFTNDAMVRAQVGSHSDKLKADSPRRHVDSVNIPLLLIHGDNDVNVDVDQSRAMVKAMKSANKPYEYLELKGADHNIAQSKDRAALLAAIERFLAVNMGAANARPVAMSAPANSQNPPLEH
jgi:dipeptidyl aminopeptidase/acylaminoacyl peptidase